MTVEGIFGLLKACWHDLEYDYSLDNDYYTFEVWVLDAFEDGEEIELYDAELVNNIKIILDNTCKEKIIGENSEEILIFENFKIIWRINSEEYKKN